MSADEHKALIRRFAERFWNGKDLDAYGDFHATEFMQNGKATTVEAVKQGLKHILKNDVPNLQHTIDDIITEGDKVAYRWTMRGTNQETGQPQAFRGITFMRIEGGKIVDDWFCSEPIEE